MLVEMFLLSFALVDGQNRPNERIYPSNTAVTVGQQFSLLCENHSDKITTTWKVLRAKEFADRVIYNGTHLTDQFKAFQVYNAEGGISILTKRFASMDDAGAYKCIQRNNSDFVVSSAQVIVFATGPVCSPKESNILEGQYLEINCSVGYIGSLSPIVKWSVGDGIDSSFDANINYLPGSSSTISTLKMYATREHQNVTFQCTVSFNQSIAVKEDQTGVRRAANFPTYDHVCKARINVLFAPEAVDITPRKDVYTLGDVLLCNADGNPTPTYEWTELGSNRVVSKEAFLTVDSTAMENHAYKCTATNNATGEETKISNTVTILAIIRFPIESTHAVRIITIVAGVICGILILLIFAVVTKRFKVLECLISFVQRESDHGPDIVQNADEHGNERLIVNENGYAQPADLGLGTPPPFQPRRFAVETRDEGAFFIHNDKAMFPVYAEVNKTSSAAAGNPSGVEIPVYGKVEKKRNENAVCFERASSSSTATDSDVCHKSNTKELPASSKNQITRADGTEYMDMGEVRSLAHSENCSSPTRPPLFERSQYAEIDHTKIFSK